jgi:demethoxyubiquinone hydroxylase (CLK1/Coq7/Cat5 family)
MLWEVDGYNVGSMVGLLGSDVVGLKVGEAVEVGS